jgi:hypothetical protein
MPRQHSHHPLHTHTMITQHHKSQCLFRPLWDLITQSECFLSLSVYFKPLSGLIMQSECFLSLSVHFKPLWDLITQSECFLSLIVYFKPLLDLITQSECFLSLIVYFKPLLDLIMLSKHGALFFERLKTTRPVLGAGFRSEALSQSTQLSDHSFLR